MPHLVLTRVHREWALTVTLKYPVSIGAGRYEYRCRIPELAKATFGKGESKRIIEAGNESEPVRFHAAVSAEFEKAFLGENVAAAPSVSPWVAFEVAERMAARLVAGTSGFADEDEARSPHTPNTWPPILYALKLGHHSVYLLKATQPCDHITLSPLFAELSIQDIRDHAKLRSLPTIVPNLITSLCGLPADLNQVLCKTSILPPIEGRAFGVAKRRPGHPVRQRKWLNFVKDETGPKAD